MRFEANASGRSPAIFFDKDGTLIENRPYNVDPRLIEFAPGAETAMRALHRRGYKFVVITNQSGVARGYFPESAITNVEIKLRLMICSAGAELHGFYYCPHHPQGRRPEYSQLCLCRKPEPGLILKAAEELDIDLSRSWFIGDILHDIEAGRRAGLETVLIDNGNETEWEVTSMRTPHHVVPDLWEAARIIIKMDAFREEIDVHDETRGLEELAEDSVREIGFDGRCPDDGAGDPRVERVQSTGSTHSPHVAIGSRGGETPPLRR